MEFEGLETIVVELLRTPELQRLRRVRQLGMAYQVFPGAEHSRLAHALGAAYVAIRFGRHLSRATRGVLIDPLRLGPEAVRDLAVAAVCHDLGHGPLSHAWEREVVGEPYDFTAWSEALGLAPDDSLRKFKWHELVGQGLLAWEDGYLHQLLERHEAGSSRRLQLMLRGDYFPEYVPRLLSGDVDVDRADFLLRDAHVSGIGYGRYDLSWLVSTSTVGETYDGRQVVGFDVRKAPRVVEQFLTARSALYETLYFHKTVRSIEGMVGLLFRRLRQVGIGREGWASVPTFKPFARLLDGSVVGCEDIVRLDDYALALLIDAVASDDRFDVTARDLAERIVARDLFKLVPVAPSRLMSFIVKPEAMQEMYAVVREYCPGQPEFYVHIDEARFSFLCDGDSEVGYFVDASGRAVEMRKHPLLARYEREPEVTFRLFTLAEAVEPLMRLLS